MNTESIPAVHVRIGDRVTNASGPIQRIDVIDGGFIFHLPFSSFTRQFGENVTIVVSK